MPTNELAVSDIAARLSVPVLHETIEIPLSCSVGIIGVAGDRRDFIALADAAIYETKRPGQRRLFT